MKPSAIGWTDYSGECLNIVTGCTPVSAGCQNCYAAAIYRRFDKDFSRVTLHPKKLGNLAKRRFGKPVYLGSGAVQYVSPKREGRRPMCFLCDTGDLLHPDVPNEFIAQALDVMAARDDVTWQVLTKRPGRLREVILWMADEWPAHSPYNAEARTGGPANIWYGVTVENQETANDRIPFLLDTPAAVRFLSVEPMLGPIDLRPYLPERDWQPFVRSGGVDWIICGAESGPHRRPFDVAWAADLYEQCDRGCVAFFGKQASGLRPGVPLELPGVGIVQEWPDGA